MPTIPEGESVAAANFAKAKNGDTLTMTSPDLNVTGEVACLHVNYALRGDVHLDISYQETSLPLSRVHLCTIHSEYQQDNPYDYFGPSIAWNSTEVMLPAGTYQLVFDAVVHSLEGGVDVFVDNITLLDENCTLIEILQFYGITYSRLMTRMELTRKERI